MLPTPTASNATPAPVQIAKQRRLDNRQRRRQEAAKRRQEEARAKAERDEARAELLAPQVQRMPIFGRDGQMLRGARVERSGVGMIRSNPVKRLAARSRNKEFPSISDRHVAAADNLLKSWEGCQGSPAPCSNYSERQSGRAAPGAISAAMLAAADAHVKCRDDVLRVQEALGALWPVVHAVVICGIDPSAWGAAQDMTADRAIGYTMAALDILARCYEPPEPRRSRILVAEFTTTIDSQI